MSSRSEYAEGKRDTSFFTIDPKKTALLIIDMQEAFLRPGASFEAPDGRKIIPNIEKLLNLSRQLHITVVWTQSDHSWPHSGILTKKFPVIMTNKILWRGIDPAFEIYREMPRPMQNEFRVVKHKYDAFYGTDLDEILRALKIETVIITGVTTEICCETTARSAFIRDYQVVFTSDGTATPLPEAHKATLAVMANMFARVMSINEVIGEIKEQAVQLQQQTIAS
jgi:biuret amidohydrolase